MTKDQLAAMQEVYARESDRLLASAATRHNVEMSNQELLLGELCNIHSIAYLEAMKATKE